MALRRSTLDFCLGGQRSCEGNAHTKEGSHTFVSLNSRLASDEEAEKRYRSPTEPKSASVRERYTTGYEPFALHAPIQWAV